MLSYSAITNRGKVTLPSVDAWSTNMNIMRDPVKSIMTRRKDKVGDNTDVTKLIDNSDRSSESILRYARGVNPFVSVSYSNTNGSGTQASLPYKINKDGEFKVPVKPPQNLLALSRLPRNTTFAVSNPSFPHNGKQLNNSRNQTTTSTVKQQIISSSVKATKTYSLQKPFQEAFENSKHSVQNIVHKSAKPNLRTGTNITTQNVTIPNKEINENNMNVFVNANLSDNRKFVGDNNKLDSERFLQETNWKTINSNINSKNNQYLQDAVDISNKKLQDVALIEYSTPLQSTSNIKYIHENFELSRNLPEYETFTNNKGDKNKVSFINNPLELERNMPEYNCHTNINGIDQIKYIHKDLDMVRNLPEWSSFTNIKHSSQKNLKPEYIRELEKKTILENMSTNNNKKGEGNNLSSRDYFLEDRLKFGEYNIPGNIPSNLRIKEINTNFECDKSKMSKNVMKQFSERYSK